MGRRSRRRAPPKLAVVPRDEGSAWWPWLAAAARERRAQTPGASHRRERRPPPPPWRTLGFGVLGGARWLLAGDHARAGTSVGEGQAGGVAPLENPGFGVLGNVRLLGEAKEERADRQWRQGVEIMGRSGDGESRRSRRRAPPKLAVVPRDEGSAWVALDCGGRARTTRSDTWGLPPPGTTPPAAPSENPWVRRPGEPAASREERERREADRQQREPTGSGGKGLKSWA